MAIIPRLGAIALLLGGVAFGSWWYFSTSEAARLSQELAVIKAEMTARIAERDAMIARLSRTHRKGVLEVVSQRMDDAGRPVDTTVRFVELDDEGREIGTTTATVPGDTVYIDAWTVHFDHHLVAEGDPLRGRTLILLRRIFSERMPPEQGVRIDTPGAVPDGYAASDVARFEQQLWAQFWKIATDTELANAFGVRVAQGEAVYKPMRAGDRFEFNVDASGGITLAPMAGG